MGFGVEGGKYGAGRGGIVCTLEGGLGVDDGVGLVVIAAVVGVARGFGVMGGGALVGVGEGNGVMTVVMA